MKEGKRKFIPNNLRCCRKACRFTQRNVAEKLGFKSTAMISRWETGRCFPETENLIDLAAVYGVLIDKLYWDFIQERRHKMSGGDELLRQNRIYGQRK